MQNNNARVAGYVTRLVRQRLLLECEYLSSAGTVNTLHRNSWVRCHYNVDSCIDDEGCATIRGNEKLLILLGMDGPRRPTQTNRIPDPAAPHPPPSYHSSPLARFASSRRPRPCTGYASRPRARA